MWTFNDACFLYRKHSLNHAFTYTHICRQMKYLAVNKLGSNKFPCTLSIYDQSTLYCTYVNTIWSQLIHTHTHTLQPPFSPIPISRLNSPTSRPHRVEQLKKVSLYTVHVYILCRVWFSKEKLTVYVVCNVHIMNQMYANIYTCIL